MARAGDAKARAIFDDFAAALARGVGAVINLFNPAVIVLVGAVSRESDLFLPRLLEELPRVSLPGLLKETRITVSGLVENAAPLGSCACVLHHIFNTTHISAARVI
jgi:predicted NBD/HSP70 family sugar kinase